MHSEFLYSGALVLWATTAWTKTKMGLRPVTYKYVPVVVLSVEDQQNIIILSDNSKFYRVTHHELKKFNIDLAYKILK